MAYIDSTNLHALPTHPERKTSRPATFCFHRGPRWSKYLQQHQGWRPLDDHFLYKDQGPPMYRLLGAHFNMYKVPPRTDYHTAIRSYHYEPRQYSSPNYRNGSLTFPPGPPPAQIAPLDDLRLSSTPDKISTHQSLTEWDKYRYLHGPPTERQVFSKPQGLETLPPTH